MESGTARQTPRLAQLALIGLGLAFAWIALSLLIGGEAARASDDDSGGLLSGVTKTVASTTTAVTDVVGGAGGAVADATEVVVETAAKTVTQTTTKVVEAAPAPVQTVVQKTTETVRTAAAPVVEKVVETVVEPVVEKVSKAAGDELVSGAVAPVVTLVGSVEKAPIVGEVIAPLGLSGAVDQLAGTVDTVVDDVVTVVTGTTDAVTGLAPVLPGDLLPVDPTLPGPIVGPSAASAVPDGALVRATGLSMPWFDTAFVLLGTSPNPAIASNSATLPPASLAFGVGVCPLVTSPPGSASASLGALGVLALIPLVAHRAWARRAGPEDDRIPRAPYYGTDVSPD